MTVEINSVEEVVREQMQLEEELLSEEESSVSSTSTTAHVSYEDGATGRAVITGVELERRYLANGFRILFEAPDGTQWRSDSVEIPIEDDPLDERGQMVLDKTGTTLESFADIVGKDLPVIRQDGEWKLDVSDSRVPIEWFQRIADIGIYKETSTGYQMTTRSVTYGLALGWLFWLPGMFVGVTPFVALALPVFLAVFVLQMTPIIADHHLIEAEPNPEATGEIDVDSGFELEEEFSQ